MAEDKSVRYVCCCSSSLIWLIFGALLIVSGVTSFLYISNVLTDTEIRLIGISAVTLLGLSIVGISARHMIKANRRS
jgi:hypothetical protein